MQTELNRSGGETARGRLEYRPGLDGLRALAVAGVFLYHAGVSWMPGGFLGVDLFFVLSGYLITSLLLREFSADGVIDLVAFWRRRARRLFPAVVVVIGFALLATLTIARDDLGRTRADALSAVVYLTNWHEIIASHSYFNQFGRPSLLQHLWSLAVEEQFYLVWPLLLLAGLRRWHPRTMLAVTAMLAATSCALMWVLYNPNADPSRVYYGTDTRAFALLIGALLAFVWPAVQAALAGRRHGATAIDLFGAAALIGVVVLFATLRDYQPWLYRGGFLLMAVAAAVLVAAASDQAGRLGRALGWRPLRWVGARSYGIYLWHWPIMQLTRANIDVPLHGAPLIILQAVATTGAAALSYRFVETPIRAGAAQQRLRSFLDRHTPRQRLAWVGGTATALLGFAGVGFSLPVPSADAAFSSTATPLARQSLSPARSLPAATVRQATERGTPGSPPVGGLPPRLAAAGSAGQSHSYRGAGQGHSHAARRAAGPPHEVLALGDSVMLGCATNLEQLIGHRLRIDAVVGRQADATIARLAQYRAAGRLPSTVIVQIGDNGPVWYADMQHLRRVLRGVPRVVLVNVRLARSWQGEVDSELRTYARGWPQAVIANWYGHSTQSMLTDGVHPSVSARSVYATVVFDALKRAEHDAGSGGSR